jgi:hypothetical protein
MRSAYGKKGGTSANAGRTAAVYEATLPDGTVVKKRSFHIFTETAVLGCYEHNGKWAASGITDGPKDWGSQIFVDARRVS